MKRKPLRARILHAFFLSKFEPMETILALSAVLHGVWLIFPEWSFQLQTSQAIGDGFRYGEIGLGALLALAGLIHLFTIAVDSQVKRKRVALFQFMMWVFLTFLAYDATDAASIIWIAYTTIAAVAGVIYLNVSLGANSDG